MSSRQWFVIVLVSIAAIALVLVSLVLSGYERDAVGILTGMIAVAVMILPALIIMRRR